MACVTDNVADNLLQEIYSFSMWLGSWTYTRQIERFLLQICVLCHCDKIISMLYLFGYGIEVRVDIEHDLQDFYGPI
jgi:hypothetical protein